MYAGRYSAAGHTSCIDWLITCSYDVLTLRHPLQELLLASLARLRLFRAAQPVGNRELIQPVERLKKRVCGLFLLELVEKVVWNLCVLWRVVGPGPASIAFRRLHRRQARRLHPT